jgi:hypothetical protein
VRNFSVALYLGFEDLKNPKTLGSARADIGFCRIDVEPQHPQLGLETRKTLGKVIYV